jgi:ribonuclease VapC
MPSSPRIILDASAIIAYLDEEPGSQIVEQWLPDSAVSMINICEVISVLVREGKPEEQVSLRVNGLVPLIVPFSWDIARITAALIVETQSKGLGLGDRAALATAKMMKLPVLTAESRWLDVAAGVDIRFIRQRTSKGV